MRWPAEWRDPAALDLLQGTPFGCLVVPPGGGFEKIVQRARQSNLAVCEGNQAPPGIELAQGQWPGIRMAHGHGDASSGPTGAPWIDSNGWLARLARARKPDCSVWIEAEPLKSADIKRLPQHLVALADGAAHGGRWVLTLDHGMAEGLAAGKQDFLDGWKRLAAAADFFDQHREWTTWPANAVLGVVSDFSGDNEFFSHEVLNLTARTNVSYAILEKSGVKPDSLKGLRAVLYPDSDPPSTELRQTILGFVEGGGLLIAGPKWDRAPGTTSAGESNPRYAIMRFGKGRIAIAYKDPDDPYQVAQDAQILVSHRHDLVRFFNGFALGSYFTVSPDRKRALVHVINYTGSAGSEPVTAHIAGRYRSAKLWPLDAAETKRPEMVVQKDAVEVHLPRLPVYAGIELEV